MSPQPSSALPVVSDPSPLNARARHWLVATGLVLVGGIAGYAISWSVQASSSKSPKELTGTVIWSSHDKGTFAFQADEEKPSKTGNETVYHYLVDRLNVPPCLAGSGAEPGRDGKHRATVHAVYANYGGKQDINIAVDVDCL